MWLCVTHCAVPSNILVCCQAGAGVLRGTAALLLMPKLLSASGFLAQLPVLFCALMLLAGFLITLLQLLV